MTSFYGELNYDSLYHHFDTSDEVLQRDFALFVQNHVSSISLGLYWYRIETAPGVYDDAFLSRVKHICDVAAQHGLEVMIDFHTLWGTDSTWCTPTWIVDPVTGTHQGLAIVRSESANLSYVNAFKHVVDYLTTAGIPNLWSWAILNEPWYWGRTSSEHDFVTENGKTQKENFIQLMQTLATYVKSKDSRPVTVRFVNAHPTTTTAAKNIFVEDWNWDSRIFSALDFIGFNVYLPAPTDPLYPAIDSITQANFTGCQDLTKSTWITEFGVKDDNDETQRQVYKTNLDYFSTLETNGVSAWVWMSEVAPSGWDQNPPFGGMNLAKIDGTARPAFYEMASRISPPPPPPRGFGLLDRLIALIAQLRDKWGI